MMNDSFERGERKGYTFTWKIENFLHNVCESREFLQSPRFKAEISGSVITEWQLVVFPHRMQGQSECKLLRVDEERPFYMNIGFQISCITADGKIETAQCKEMHTFHKDDFYEFHNKWNWESMLKKRSFYFPNDSFTIQCLLWLPSRQIAYSQEYLAVTHLELTRIFFEKSIHDFNSLFLGNKEKCSPLPDEELEITLCLKEGYLSVEFCSRASKKPKIHLKCKLSACNSRGIPLQEMEKCHLFQSNENIWKFPDFIKFNKLIIKNHFFDDSVNLEFELIMHTGKIYSRIIEANSIQPAISDVELYAFDSLSQEFGAIYFQKQYTDVVLKSGKETFLTHKAILCARSPVFAAMFDNNMIEKESGVVNIEDVDPAILDKLLTFMYTGVVRISDEETAINLMIVSDRYQVLTLIEKCSIFLKGIISTQNVSRLLQLADTLQENSLKKSALEFICDQHRTVFSTNEWKQFIEQNGKLASDVLQKVSERYFNY